MTTRRWIVGVKIMVIRMTLKIRVRGGMIKKKAVHV
jgi:hypothetical protein